MAGWPAFATILLEQQLDGPGQVAVRPGCVMNRKWKGILQAASIILLLAVCLLTGGSQSPFRFAYYPLIILLGLRIGYTLLLQAGFTFSILFVLLVIVDHPASRQLVDLLAEAFSFFLVTMTTAFAIRNLAAERERVENATTTFHGMSEDLKHRTMNLQTTLEALSEAHKRLQESDGRRPSFSPTFPTNCGPLFPQSAPTPRSFSATTTSTTLRGGTSSGRLTRRAKG